MKLVADMFADTKGADDAAEEPLPTADVHAAANGREPHASGRELAACPRPGTEQPCLGQAAIDFAIAAMSGEISPGTGEMAQATPCQYGRSCWVGTPECSSVTRPELPPPLGPRRDSPFAARRDSPLLPPRDSPLVPRGREVATPGTQLRPGPAEVLGAGAGGEVTPCHPFQTNTTWTPKWSTPFRSRSEQRSTPHRRADSPSVVELNREEHASAVVAEFEAVLGKLFPRSVGAVVPQTIDDRPLVAAVATPQQPRNRFAMTTPARSCSARKPRNGSPRQGSPRLASPDERGTARPDRQRALTERSISWQHDAPWQHSSATQLGGPYESSIVEETFRAFCGAHRTLDGRSFAKLCKDCHLIDRRFTATDADLIFAKVVPSGLRRVDLPQFEMALRLVAEKKGLEEDSIRRAVAQSKGPTLQATKAEAVRFHDDKSTYTGTHIYGGPESSCKGLGHVPPQPQLALYPSEPPKSWMPPPTWVRSPRASARSESPPQASPRQQSGGGSSVAVAPGDSVEATFRAFSGARQDLDGRSWTKLCKDCHLIDKRLTATDADLIFARVVPSGQRRINFPHFEAALRLVAEKKAVDEPSVRRAVAGSSGPTMNATKTDAVRFHDDKSTYTGTHLHGGPEVGAKGMGTAALGSA